jgi:hypothetical protein
MGNSSKTVCRWYNETSGMKRAYDKGLLDKKWIADYCFNGGNKCVRKKRFEQEGYVSPDYILPNGTADEHLKKAKQEGTF